MKRAIRLLIWPGALIILVLATIIVNIALVMAATSVDSGPTSSPTEATE